MKLATLLLVTLITMWTKHWVAILPFETSKLSFQHQRHCGSFCSTTKEKVSDRVNISMLMHEVVSTAEKYDPPTVFEKIELIWDFKS